MFGLFKKKRALDISHIEGALMARSVEAYLSAQLELSSKTKEDVLRSKWCMGYLMGLCDAIAQKRDIPQPDDLLVISFSFGVFFPQNPDAFNIALNLAENCEFVAGQNVGGSEMHGLLLGEKIVPMGLFDYWRGARVAKKASNVSEAVAAMTAHLAPHAGNDTALWEHMEAAFKLGFGRAVDKDDAHDIMLCQVAIAPFGTR